MFRIVKRRFCSRNASLVASARDLSIRSCAVTRRTAISTARVATLRTLAPRVTGSDAGPASCSAAICELKISTATIVLDLVLGT